jgi:hypothetical protein
MLDGASDDAAASPVYLYMALAHHIRMVMMVMYT